MRPLHRPRHSWRENSAFARLAQRSHRSRRHRQHQQRRRHFKLRDARARPSSSHLRLRPGPQSFHRCPPRPSKRKNQNSRRRRPRPRSQHQCRLRWRWFPRRWHWRNYGWRRNRNLLLHEKCFDRVRLVCPHRDSPRRSFLETPHGSQHPLWPRRRSRNGGACLAPCRRTHLAASWRRTPDRSSRRLPR